MWCLYFNPRSHEESDECYPCTHQATRDFNPRSHEESDLLTHKWRNVAKQFQSTLSRRERPFYVGIRHKMKLFQSTLSRRERPMDIILDFMDFPISIHALTKRATKFFIQSNDCLQNFNPRSHEESDVDVIYIPTVSYKFQSTLSRRERPDY